MILRPRESDKVAKIAGDSAWKIMYIVIVKLIAWAEVSRRRARRGKEGQVDSCSERRGNCC